MAESPGRSDVVIQVPRGCDAQRAGVGCGCSGQCQELIDVVLAADYWRAVGERDEARRVSKYAYEACGHALRLAENDRGSDRMAYQVVREEPRRPFGPEGRGGR